MTHKIFNPSQPLTKDLVPLKIPYLVKEGWGFIALCYISSPLTWGFFMFVLNRLDKFISFLLGKSYKFPDSVYGVSTLLFIIFIFYVPIHLVFSKTSRFILEVVQHHLKNDDQDKAEKVALMLDYQLWYREFKRNGWFREFIVNRNIVEKSSRFKRFQERYQNTWTSS